MFFNNIHLLFIGTALFFMYIKQFGANEIKLNYMHVHLLHDYLFV